MGDAVDGDGGGEASAKGMLVECPVFLALGLLGIQGAWTAASTTSRGKGAISMDGGGNAPNATPP